ncbi:MAG: hypothetical protein HQK75_17455, partial [Candidatus Magnetomorum sp.]|nr:hypothetical protein [Candidatus Magnetomorum sp.]
DLEFVEVIVSSGDYSLQGASSARVAIKDNSESALSGDIDNNESLDLKDAIVALQICAGKDVAGISVESSINNNRIEIKDVLYILKEIAGK